MTPSKKWTRIALVAVLAGVSAYGIVALLSECPARKSLPGHGSQSSIHNRSGVPKAPATDAAQEPPRDVGQLAEIALERSVVNIGSILKGAEFDVIWGLRQALKLNPKPRIESFIRSWLRRNDSSKIMLLNPKAPRITLPKDPGWGILKFKAYCLAPFAAPKGRARRLINEFLSLDASGYALTHQLLVIVWAEQTGLGLSSKSTAKKRELLEKIAAEQDGDPAFSDLFVERAAVLLLFGERPHPSEHRWMNRIIQNQEKTGGWNASGVEYEFKFDGRSFPFRPTAEHTTGLAIIALMAFTAKR